jgi:hypothetical protein
MRALTGPFDVELSGRSDGSRYRQTALAVEKDGAVTLSAHEMGAGLEAAWGADDEERTVSIPAEVVAKLAVALLAERLRGEADPIGALVDLCDAHGVAHRVACWT